MTRFFAPLLAFAAAAYVYNKNSGATTEFVFLFPLNRIYEDPLVAAERTWQVLVGLGLLWLVSDLLSLFRTRGKAKAEEQSEEAG